MIIKYSCWMLILVLLCGCRGNNDSAKNNYLQLKLVSILHEQLDNSFDLAEDPQLNKAFFEPLDLFLDENSADPAYEICVLLKSNALMKNKDRIGLKLSEVKTIYFSSPSKKKYRLYGENLDEMVDLIYQSD